MPSESPQQQRARHKAAQRPKPARVDASGHGIETIAPPGLPKGRPTAARLHDWVLQTRSALPASAGPEAFRRAQAVNAAAFQECLRQVRTTCGDLGDTLALVWEDYCSLFESLFSRLHPLRDELLKAEMRARAGKQRESELRAAVQERDQGLAAMKRELASWMARNNTLQDSNEHIQMDMLQRKRAVAAETARLSKLLETERAKVAKLLAEKGADHEQAAEDERLEQERRKAMAKELTLLRKKHLVQVRELEMLRVAKLSDAGHQWKHQMERLEHELGSVMQERSKMAEERDEARRQAEEQRGQAQLLERVNGEVVAELEDLKLVLLELHKHGINVEHVLREEIESAPNSPSPKNSPKRGLRLLLQKAASGLGAEAGEGGSPRASPHASPLRKQRNLDPLAATVS